MSRVALEVSGLDEALAQLAAVEGRMRSLEPAMRVIAQLIQRHVDDRFATSTDPAGNPWAPLSDSTLRSRRGSTATILVDTARLRNSIHADAAGDRVEFGTNVTYGFVHMTGSADGSLEERRFLPVVYVGGEWLLDAEGPAGELWQRAAEVLQRFVADGRV